MLVFVLTVELFVLFVYLFHTNMYNGIRLGEEAQAACKCSY